MVPGYQITIQYPPPSSTPSARLPGSSVRSDCQTQPSFFLAEARPLRFLGLPSFFFSPRPEHHHISSAPPPTHNGMIFFGFLRLVRSPAPYHPPPAPLVNRRWRWRWRCVRLFLQAGGARTRPSIYGRWRAGLAPSLQWCVGPAALPTPLPALPHLDPGGKMPI